MPIILTNGFFLIFDLLFGLVSYQMIVFGWDQFQISKLFLFFSYFINSLVSINSIRLDDFVLTTMCDVMKEACVMYVCGLVNCRERPKHSFFRNLFGPAFGFCTFCFIQFSFLYCYLFEVKFCMCKFCYSLHLHSFDFILFCLFFAFCLNRRLH